MQLTPRPHGCRGIAPSGEGTGRRPRDVPVSSRRGLTRARPRDLNPFTARGRQTRCARTPPASSHADGQTTAMTIAIEDAERRCAAALHDLARLLEGGTIDLSQAAELEAKALARFTGSVRELELHGVESLDPSPPRAPGVARRAVARGAARRAPPSPAPARHRPARAGAARTPDVRRARRPRRARSPAPPGRRRRREALATRDELAAAGLL